jgi:phosphoglycerate dehydrogenase-like enzyme
MTLLHVHILNEPEPEHLQILRAELLPGIELTCGEDLPEPAGFEVLVAGLVTAEMVDASPRLQTLVVPYAGLPVKTREVMQARPGIAVHNLHHNAVVTAETALSLLLAAAKVVIPMDRNLREAHWSGRGEDNHAVLLSGKTALLLGYGSIGRRLGRILRSLDMEVVAVRRNAEPGESDAGIEVHGEDALDDLLPSSRVLVVSTPLTERTRGIIDRRRLALLPEHSILVNVARGPVVSEEALFDALKNGHLHSAGIDVWYRYPGKDGDPTNTPPSEFPFGDLDNVVMSPHRGGWLHEVEAHRMRHLAALLNALKRGDPAPHRVDVEEGY